MFLYKSIAIQDKFTVSTLRQIGMAELPAILDNCLLV